MIYIASIAANCAPAVWDALGLLVSGNSNTHFTTKKFFSIYSSNGIVCVASVIEADEGEPTRLIGVEIARNVNITNITISECIKA